MPGPHGGSLLLPPGDRVAPLAEVAKDFALVLKVAGSMSAVNVFFENIWGLARECEGGQNTIPDQDVILNNECHHL